MTSTATPKFDLSTTATLARSVRAGFKLTSSEAADKCDAFYAADGDPGWHAAAVWLRVAARFGEVDLDRAAAGTAR